MNYRYEQVDDEARIVFISDTGVGMSITNAAERVVAEVNNAYPGYRIVYRDTNGDIDELGHENGVFTSYIFLQPGTYDY